MSNLIPSLRKDLSGGKPFRGRGNGTTQTQTAVKKPLFSEIGRRRLKIGAIVGVAALVIGGVSGSLWYYQPVGGIGSVKPSTVDVGQQAAFLFDSNRGVSPYRYHWAFGDGLWSEEQNALHSYTVAGSYIVGVTVWDRAGRSVTWTTTVQVNRLPSVEGTISPLVPTGSFNASFTAEAKDGTPGYSYSWQFGDGSSSTLQNPSHYFKPGNYVAVVTVADSVGMTSSWRTAISVSPVSVVGAMSPNVGYGPVNVSFLAQGYGGTPSYHYLWQFGDGATSTEQNPTHRYSVGNYTAQVMITDALGATDSWAGSVSVRWPLTVGVSHWLDSGGNQEDFLCTPDQGLAPYTFYWDFGGGHTTTVQNPVYGYVPGTHSVTLIVGDAAGEVVQRQITWTM